MTKNLIGRYKLNRKNFLCGNGEKGGISAKAA